MRTLFFKIFIAFFLTVALLGVLLELTAVRGEMRRVDRVFRPLARQMAQQVAEAYERDGPGDFASTIGRLPVTAALLDDRGEPIGPLPEALGPARTMLRELQSDPGESLSDFTASQNFALQPVVTASGRRYVFAFVVPHERWMAILNTLDQYPAVRLSLVGVVAGVICFVLARHITQPLVRLRETAAQMAEGRLEARAGPTIARRHDEIGALGRDFDTMAERLAALVDSQRRLLADVSHELRSPLARLAVAAGLARRHSSGSPVDRTELLAALDRIEQETERLDQLIGQSLTLARIDSAVDTGAPERFDLTNVVQQVAADGDYEARATGRQVVILEAAPCTTVGIPDLVRSAIENVVRNAIRYTDRGTAVELTLRRRVDEPSVRVSLHVRDHGPGLPDAELAQGFRPFRTIVPGAKAAGAGLGLAIADRVVRLHGGQMQAQNAPGGGLDVEMTWPIDLSTGEPPQTESE